MRVVIKDCEKMRDMCSVIGVLLCVLLVVVRVVPIFFVVML